MDPVGTVPIGNQVQFPPGKFTRGSMDPVGTVPIGNQVQFPPGKFTRGTMDPVGYSSNRKSSPVSPRKVYQRVNGSSWVQFQ